MTKRRTKGDGGLVQRHDHATCPPVVDTGRLDDKGRPIMERPEHTCRGRWAGTLILELPNGRKVTKYLYGRTQREAKAKLDKARRERDAGILVAKSPTVEAWMATWLKRRKLPPKPLKPNAWNGYESKVRIHIVPALGKKRLSDLRPQMIESFYDGLREGHAESTVRQVHAILTKALKDAVRVGALGRTPMDRVDPPGTETNERDQWTIDQATTALRAAGESARWWLAIFYGMRQGEVLGMDWRYFDWDAHTFTVEETRQNDYGYGQAILGTPKAKASRRELPMVPQVEVRLRLLWESQGRPDCGLVFPNSRARLMDTKADWNAWRRFIDSATTPPFSPLPYIALHAARNTASSLMEAAGIPDRLVGQILGQSQIKTTHHYQKAELDRVRVALMSMSDRLELE